MRLAASQQMMWEFMTALDPAHPGNSRLVVVEFRRLLGDLDVAVLDAAVGDVIARHDALRMRFARIGADPAVEILPEVASPLEHHDVSDLPPDERRRWVERLVHAHRTRAFDPCAAPLWRAALVRLSPGEHVLALTCFHMVSDGWSCQLFMADVVHAYAARLGIRPPQPPLPAGLHRFAGIVALQDALAGDPDRAAYWRDRLRPLPGGYQLFPAGKPGPADDLSAEVPDRFAFPAEVAGGLRGVARRARTSPYIALLAAWQVLLALRSGRRRIVLGTTTLGRDTAPERELFGQFTNNVYVPADVDPDRPLLDVVAAAHAETRAAMAHVAAFHTVAAAVDPDFDRHRPWPDNHLFDGWFQSAAPAAPTIELPGLVVEPVDITARPAPDAPAPVVASDVPPECLPVWVKRGSPIVVVDDDRAGGVIIRNRSFFGDDLVAGLVADYQAVVATLVTAPGTPVGRVRLPDGASFGSAYPGYRTGNTSGGCHRHGRDAG
ncbi:condensation domain-containing protein [Dactylosporangium sucinum]|uniref:Condensation domain-containing protein n=1 Tax=Dactylosporangium sucinum TaxID=1424081 RepID=A0A917TZU2_9ACTN|nr:condensation domain-containing protein [Dactylosporangium sucinum]GGM46998.1 hypothetical protein GCM10007977_055810 [Dactylosporangium sucinum]